MFDKKKHELDATSRFDFILEDLFDLAADYLGANVSLHEALATAATIEDFGSGYISVENGVCYWYDDTVAAMADAAQYLEDPKHSGLVLVYHIANTGDCWYKGQTYLLTRTK